MSFKLNKDQIHPEDNVDYPEPGQYIMVSVNENRLEGPVIYDGILIFIGQSKIGQVLVLNDSDDDTIWIDLERVIGLIKFNENNIDDEEESKEEEEEEDSKTIH